MNLSNKDLAVMIRLAQDEMEHRGIYWLYSLSLADLTTRLQAELSQKQSRSTARRLDVQRDAMSDFDRDKIGYEDNDGTLGLRDRRG